MSLHINTNILLIDSKKNLYVLHSLSKGDRRTYAALRLLGGVGSVLNPTNREEEDLLTVDMSSLFNNYRIFTTAGNITVECKLHSVLIEHQRVELVKNVAGNDMKFVRFVGDSPLKRAGLFFHKPSIS